LNLTPYNSEKDMPTIEKVPEDTRKKQDLIDLVIILVIFSIGILLFLYMISGMCGNEILKEVPDSNNKYKAVIFSRDCGATTGSSIQISIMQSDKTLKNKGGNIFVMGHDGRGSAEVKWINDKKLRINYHKPDRIYHQKKGFFGIEIIYTEN